MVGHYIDASEIPQSDNSFLSLVDRFQKVRENPDLMVVERHQPQANYIPVINPGRIVCPEEFHDFRGRDVDFDMPWYQIAKNAVETATANYHTKAKFSSGAQEICKSNEKKVKNCLTKARGLIEKEANWTQEMPNSSFLLASEWSGETLDLCGALSVSTGISNITYIQSLDYFSGAMFWKEMIEYLDNVIMGQVSIYDKLKNWRQSNNWPRTLTIICSMVCSHSEILNVLDSAIKMPFTSNSHLPY